MPFNLPGRVTVGLIKVHRRCRQSSGGATRTADSADRHTADDGSLRLSTDLPLLGGRYEYVGCIGHGTFSQILKCKDTYKQRKSYAQSPARANDASALDDTFVAIKVMNRKFRDIGAQELEMLRYLRACDRQGVIKLVQVVGSFEFNGHFCVVMRCLGPSLVQWDGSRMQQHVSSNAAGLLGPVENDDGTCTQLVHQSKRLGYVRKIGVQLVGTLLFLSKHKVIHADMKPDNILTDAPILTGGKGGLATTNQSLENSDGGSSRAWLVDFGNAMLVQNSSLYHDDFEVQSLCYRAPEVLLGLPFGCAIDMWSLGCVLAELVTGQPLFTGKNRRELLERMVSLLGPLPKAAFERAKFFPVFFDEFPKYFRSSSSPSSSTPVLPYYPSGSSLPSAAAVMRVPSDAAEQPWAPDTDLRSEDAMTDLRREQLRTSLGLQALGREGAHFANFLESCLQYDPDMRLTPAEALRHPFFSTLFPFDLLHQCGAGLPPRHTSPAIPAATAPGRRTVPTWSSSDSPATFKEEQQSVTRGASFVSPAQPHDLPSTGLKWSSNQGGENSSILGTRGGRDRSQILPSSQPLFCPQKLATTSNANAALATIKIDADTISASKSSEEAVADEIAAPVAANSGRTPKSLSAPDVTLSDFACISSSSSSSAVDKSTAAADTTPSLVDQAEIDDVKLITNETYMVSEETAEPSEDAQHGRRTGSKRTRGVDTAVNPAAAGRRSRERLKPRPFWTAAGTVGAAAHQKQKHIELQAALQAEAAAATATASAGGAKKGKAAVRAMKEKDAQASSLVPGRAAASTVAISSNSKVRSVKNTHSANEKEHGNWNEPNRRTKRKRQPMVSEAERAQRGRFPLSRPPTLSEDQLALREAQQALAAAASGRIPPSTRRPTIMSDEDGDDSDDKNGSTNEDEYELQAKQQFGDDGQSSSDLD